MEVGKGAHVAGADRQAAIEHDRADPLRAFRALVGDVTAGLSPDARRRLENVAVRLETLPSADAIRRGVKPDAAAHRSRRPEDVLTLYQANLENRAESEPELRGLVERTLSRA